jgi:hypothetical protein
MAGGLYVLAFPEETQWRPLTEAAAVRDNLRLFIEGTHQTLRAALDIDYVVHDLAPHRFEMGDGGEVRLRGYSALMPWRTTASYAMSSLRRIGEDDEEEEEEEEEYSWLIRRGDPEMAAQLEAALARPGADLVKVMEDRYGLAVGGDDDDDEGDAVFLTAYLGYRGINTRQELDALLGHMKDRLLAALGGLLLRKKDAAEEEVVVEEEEEEEVDPFKEGPVEAPSRDRFALSPEEYAACVRVLFGEDLGVAADLLAGGIATRRPAAERLLTEIIMDAHLLRRGFRLANCDRERLKPANFVDNGEATAPRQEVEEEEEVVVLAPAARRRKDDENERVGAIDPAILEQLPAPIRRYLVEHDALLAKDESEDDRIGYVVGEFGRIMAILDDVAALPAGISLAATSRFCGFMFKVRTRVSFP